MRFWCPIIRRDCCFFYILVLLEPSYNNVLLMLASHLNWLLSRFNHLLSCKANIFPSRIPFFSLLASWLNSGCLNCYIFSFFPCLKVHLYAASFLHFLERRGYLSYLSYWFHAWTCSPAFQRFAVRTSKRMEEVAYMGKCFFLSLLLSHQVLLLPVL